MWSWNEPLSPVAGVIALDLLAQVTPFDPGMTALVRDLGVVAVLVWYLWHSVRIGHPAMLAAFAAEQEKSREAFRVEQDAAREAFAVEQNRQREHYEAMFIRYEQLVAKTVQSANKTVGDVRDAAQVVVNEVGTAVKLIQGPEHKE